VGEKDDCHSSPSGATMTGDGGENDFGFPVAELAAAEDNAAPPVSLACVTRATGRVSLNNCV